MFKQHLKEWFLPIVLPFALTLGLTFGFIEYVDVRAVFSIYGMTVTNLQVLCLIPTVCFCVYVKILDVFSHEDV